MRTKKLKLANDFGEKLDVLIEGDPNSPEILVFVHGYGTDKDEGFASFIDLSNAFKNDFLNIRYDQSGFGASEGEDSAFHLQKSAGDLNTILKWLRRNYPDKKINIIAHSLGTFVVLLLSPQGIDKIVLTSIINSNLDYVIKNLKERINQSGGRVNETGITVYPRSRGGVQLIGQDLWRTLKNLKPVELLEDLSKSSKIIIFKPVNEDVLGSKYFDEYKTIKSVEYVELPGNHNFTDLKDRERLITKMRQFLIQP